MTRKEVENEKKRWF